MYKLFGILSMLLCLVLFSMPVFAQPTVLADDAISTGVSREAVFKAVKILDATEFSRLNYLDDFIETSHAVYSKEIKPSFLSAVKTDTKILRQVFDTFKVTAISHNLSAMARNGVIKIPKRTVL